MTETTTIYLARTPELHDRLRKYKIFIDEEYVGDISRDETRKFQLVPGEHRIRLKIDWCGSNTLVLNARPNQDIYLECGNNCGNFPINIVRTFIALIFVPSSFLYVKRTWFFGLRRKFFLGKFYRHHYTIACKQPGPKKIYWNSPFRMLIPPSPLSVGPDGILRSIHVRSEK